MRLYIADDNVQFRKGIAELLSNAPGIEVIGASGDVRGAIRGIQKLRPDAVILDFHMSGGNGLDVLAALKRMRPSPVVMVLTVGTREELQERCLAAGAAYFFEKSSDLQKMMVLLKKLAARFASSHALYHSSRGVS